MKKKFGFLFSFALILGTIIIPNTIPAQATHIDDCPAIFHFNEVKHGTTGNDDILKWEIPKAFCYDLLAGDDDATFWDRPDVTTQCCNDRIWGRDGADHIIAGGGGDQDNWVRGDDGLDWLEGGSGGDHLIGGNGGDTLQDNFDLQWPNGAGDDDHDRFWGEDGNDTIDASTSGTEQNVDKIYDGFGNDTIYADHTDIWYKCEDNAQDTVYNVGLIYGPDPDYCYPNANQTF